MTHAYTLYNEQTAELTEQGFVKVCEAIADEVVNSCPNDYPNKRIGGEITDGRQTVEFEVEYLAKCKFIYISLRKLAGYTLDSDGELVCDIPLKYTTEIEWVAARVTTEHYELVSVVDYKNWQREDE